MQNPNKTNHQKKKNKEGNGKGNQKQQTKNIKTSRKRKQKKLQFWREHGRPITKVRQLRNNVKYLEKKNRPSHPDTITKKTEVRKTDKVPDLRQVRPISFRLAAVF